MAIRRLNKKVAFIGSAVVVFLLLAVIAVVLRLGQDPQEYIQDGEAALESVCAVPNAFRKLCMALL